MVNFQQRKKFMSVSLETKELIELLLTQTTKEDLCEDPSTCMEYGPNVEPCIRGMWHPIETKTFFAKAWEVPRNVLSNYQNKFMVDEIEKPGHHHNPIINRINAMPFIKQNTNNTNLLTRVEEKWNKQLQPNNLSEKETEGRNGYIITQILKDFFKIDVKEHPALATGKVTDHLLKNSTCHAPFDIHYTF